MDANTASMMTAGTQEGQMITFMFMIFLVAMITIGMYISGKAVFHAVLLRRKKKKILSKIKSAQMGEGKKFKYVVHTSDSDGVPVLVETEKTFEFI